MERRDFINILSASMAGIALGCRRPEQKLAPLSRPVEYMTPGNSVFYTSVFQNKNCSQGIIIKTREGRPVKIEGNPNHISNSGSSSVLMQSLVYSLYHPARMKPPKINQKPVSLTVAINNLIVNIKKSIVAGLDVIFLYAPNCSQSYHALQEIVTMRFPQIKFVEYHPLHKSNPKASLNKILFDVDAEFIPDLSKAELIVSFGDDMLGSDPNSLYHTRQFYSELDDGERKNRRRQLLMFESVKTLTGLKADSRYIIRPEEAEIILGDIFKGILKRIGKLRELLEFLDRYNYKNPSVVNDLIQQILNNQNSVFVSVDKSHSLNCHLFAAIINYFSGAICNDGILSGESMVPFSEDKTVEWNQFIDSLNEKRIGTIIFSGVNPEYSGSVDLIKLLKAIPKESKITVGLIEDETADKSGTYIPESHFLEYWDDVVSFDGTLSIQQPVISPLNKNSISSRELLLKIANELSPDIKLPGNYYEFLRARWSGLVKSVGDWENILKQGFVKIKKENIKVKLNENKIGSLLTSDETKISTKLKLVVTKNSIIGTGEFSWLPWLLEMPDPVTKISWDNVAAMNPATASKNGFSEGDVITVRHKGNTVSLPVSVIPGIADDIVWSYYGYGRKIKDLPETNVGGNLFSLFVHSDENILDIAIEKTGRMQKLIKSSNSNRLLSEVCTPYEINRAASINPGYIYLSHKWAMAIVVDLCTGCSSCIMACQSENNIPAVGKEEVSTNGLMNWLRIERLTDSAGRIYSIPIMCQHCDNAPCEAVCPVNATTHSPEGLNEMTYNRCIGARFCMANCPYKVRKFNFRNFSNDLKKPLEFALNPDVTVRSGGIAEKCTFCIQRINEARYRAKDNGLNSIADGMAITACQQACPAGAIIFGDINNPDSKISKLLNKRKHYRMLGGLNTGTNVFYIL